MNSLRPAAAITRLRRPLAFVCLAIVIGTAARPSGAQFGGDPGTLERRVKAAFLYKFTGYVTWPDATFAGADTSITIGVIGDDALAAELARVVSGRTVDGRPLAVKRLQGEPLTGIHMLFIGRAENARLKHLIAPLQTRSVLIVTESERALDQGSTINFLTASGHVRFEIALDAAKKRGLKLSSRLLTVAQNVRTGTLP